MVAGRDLKMGQMADAEPAGRPRESPPFDPYREDVALYLETFRHTVGVMQTGTLMGLFKGGYPEACSIMGAIYLVGAIVIWFAPETRGQPLPE